MQVLWLVAAAWATDASDATAAPAKVFPYEIVSRELPNGLAVHVVPMSSDGVVALYTWMDVGSRDEVDAGRTGFAHFFEHLMFYGTPTVGREAREVEILRLGVDENAWTWFDETVYHGVLSAENLPRMLEIEADRFQNLHLTEEDVRREAGAVYGEFRKSQASPDGQLVEKLYATAFGTHTYGHDTIGYEADIAAMPTAFDYSQRFFSRFYRPENATILVVGDVKPDEVFPLVEKHWGSWKKGEEPRPEIPAEPAQKEMRRATIAWKTPTAPRLAMGWHIPAHDPSDPETAAVDLAAYLLMSPVGTLRRRLVEEEGIAYDVGGGSDTLVDPGLFTVYVTVKEPAHLDRAEAIVREEVAKLQASVDPAYLDATRTRTRYGFLSALDDPDTVAGALGSEMRRAGGDPTAIDRYFASFDAQTPEQVSAAASKYLVDSGLSVVTLVPVASEGGAE